MISSIRRRVVARLVPAWLILSVILGTLTYWMESRLVDKFVFDLVTEAAGNFDAPDNAAMFYGAPEGHRQALREFLEQTHFVSLRLYSTEQRPLIEVWETENRDLAAAAASHRHDFPAAGDHHHNKILVGDTLYIQVLIPWVLVQMWRWKAPAPRWR